MKKGDDQRQRIIEAAARLFDQRGYERTSVQDILNELNLSKGGFYHHFDAKLSLLTAICDQRTAQAQRAMVDAVTACRGNALQKLNLLFAGAGLLNGQDVGYIALMLKVAYRGEGAMLRERIRMSSVEGALPLLRSIIHEGIAQKLFFTRYPDAVGELLLHLFANLMDMIAQSLAGGEDALLGALARLEACRFAVEQLLGAPYGSVALMDMNAIAGLAAALAEDAPAE